MATEALVRIKFSPEGVPQLVQTGRVLDGIKTKVDRLKGSASGVFGKFTQLMSPVTGVFKGVFGAVSSLAMGPFRLLRGAIGFVGDAFMGLVGLIKAHPLVTLVGGFLAAAAMTAFTRSVLTAANVQEEAFKRVESAAISTGEVVYDFMGEQISAWDVNKGRIESITTALQRKTKFGDEVQMEALSELITVLGDTEKALDTLPLVLDVAARHGLDVASAARAIGLAMKGDIGLIGRYVPALRGLGKEEKTVENITRILRDTYEGTAETMARTSSGALAQLGNAWGEVKETIGGVIQNALAPLARWLTENLYKLNDWIRAVAEGRRSLQEFGSVLFDWLKDIGKGLYDRLAADLRSIGPKLYEAIRSGIDNALPYAETAGTYIWGALSAAWPIFIETMKGVWDKAYPIIQNGIDKAYSIIQVGISKLQEFFTSVVVPFAEIGKEWGIALGESLITEFLRFLGRHPILPIAIGALAGSRFGLPGAVAGGVAGMLGGAEIAASGLGVLDTIEKEKAAREEERERQRSIFEGVSPETRAAFRRSGKFNLAVPTIEEIAPGIFGKETSKSVVPDLKRQPPALSQLTPAVHTIYYGGQPMMPGQSTPAVNNLELVKLMGVMVDEMKAMNRKVATGRSGDVHYFNN